MTDGWTDINGDSLPSDWTPGGPLTPPGDWAGTCGCAPPGGPAIADSITIKGSPGAITSVQNGKSLWSLVLNDGTPAADFRIDRFDDTGALIDSPMDIVRATGVVSFNDPVMLARDPVEPMEAVTLEYLEAHGAGVEEAPDNQTYGRTLGAWNLVVPAAGGTFTGQTNLAVGGAVTGGALLFAGNAVCSLPTVAQLQIGGGSLGQVPATDGSGNLSWVTPVTGGPYLPLSGGTVTGSLTVNQVLTVQGSNSMVLNAPVTGGSQRTILGMGANVPRWGLTLGDGTAEGAGNAGANFSLAAYSVTGAFLGNWLTIARADGSTVFNGSGLTIQGGLAVNGLLALADPTHLAIYGGAAGQALTTNGAGALSWGTVASGPPVIIGDTAPASPAVGALWWDSVGGQLYVWYSDPNTSQWVSATNAASLPPPASTTVLGSVKVDGTSIKAAADGTISTVPIPMGDNRIINGDMRVDQRWNGSSGTAIGYTVDRWQYSGTQPNKGSWGRTASGFPGFPYCLAYNSTSPYTLLTGDFFQFYQAIEADMVSDFQWGTANALPVTLSFWASSTLAGTFSGSIGNPSGTRSYPFTFAIPVAGANTRIVVAIPGDIAGTWPMSGNGAGVGVHFDLGAGATFRGPANAWAGGNYVGATGAVSIAAINGASFYVTGVKLEIGSVATPFNRQSLAKSMADCQRYYQVFGGGNTVVAGYGAALGVTLSIISLPYMRAAPTAAFSNMTYANSSAISLAEFASNRITTQCTITAAGFGYAYGTMTLSAEL